MKGTTNGTVTDIDGNFSIEADPNSVLNISYIGYLSKEIVVGNQKTIMSYYWKIRKRWMKLS